MQEEKDRVYKIGNNLIEFPHALIEKLLDWNKPPRNTDRYYDKRFTRSLLMSMVPKDRLVGSNVSEDEKQFILRELINISYCCSILIFKIFSIGLLEIRCKGDMDRMAKFEGYVNELCQEQK